ncbi:hypothetical protein VNO77_10136 [Canavalia gladiata]|uniref:Uncharacterized protein n=1 Tax=Canavalia gladiata TaxID=3824 RepID=A0AAN9MA12_CANGL
MMQNAESNTPKHALISKLQSKKKSAVLHSGMTLQLTNELDVIKTHITQDRIGMPINWKNKGPGMDDMKCQNYSLIILLAK